MIQHTFQTTVAVRIPVRVSGYYDLTGEFVVEEVSSILDKTDDLLMRLNCHDIDELKDEAAARYGEALDQYDEDMRMEQQERMKAE